MVSKLEFSHAVAAVRKERGLTQGQLADDLARSYSAFESLNQPTLSQWESGKVTPSLLKRLAFSHYIGEQYEYTSSEYKRIKASQSKNIYLSFKDIVYEYQVTDVKSCSLNQISDSEFEQIDAVHKQLITPGGVEDTLNQFRESPSKARLYYCKGMLVGHLIYQELRSEFRILSLWHLGRSILKFLVTDIIQVMGNAIIHFPVHEPVIKQLLFDIFIRDFYHHRRVTFFKAPATHIFENPMVKHCFDGLLDLVLYRFHQVGNEFMQSRQEAH
ncbi:helix-turn-helix domain-containing protein [Vibrio owensii]|uniref:helix-turn-helix domain-containing protein n=1 Tax=Vibrio owensii TaxID=696485 RepID=UPI003CE47DC3